MSRTKKVLETKQIPAYGTPVRGLKAPADVRTRWKRTHYVTGDGDHNVYIPRPGSDHSHIKSLGF